MIAAWAIVRHREIQALVAANSSKQLAKDAKREAQKADAIAKLQRYDATELEIIHHLQLLGARPPKVDKDGAETRRHARPDAVASDDGGNVNVQDRKRMLTEGNE